MQNISFKFNLKDKELNNTNLLVCESIFANLIYFFIKDFSLKANFHLDLNTRAKFSLQSDKNEKILLDLIVHKFFSEHNKNHSHFDLSIYKKIKQEFKKEIFNKEEFATFLNEFAPFKQKQKAFFEILIKNEVQSLEVQINHKVLKINKNDFAKRLLQTTKIKEVINEKILIISPVIQKSNKKWLGLLNNEQINFTINDKLFLNKVYANKFQFSAKTFLHCEIEVETITQIKQTKKYKVLQVFDDLKTLQANAQNILPKQTNLFEDMIF